MEKAYANGNKNPNAHMHAVKIDREKAKLGPKNPNFLTNEDSTIRMMEDLITPQDPRGPWGLWAP